MKIPIIKKTTAVILVEPVGPINVGSVARLCANFGIKELRLVSPRCNPRAPEAMRMAVKGVELLQEAKVFSSLSEAIADCRKVIATCSRIEHGEIPLYSPEEIIPSLNEWPSKSTIALVFGREDRGLTNQELLLANRVVKIESEKSYPSLNLSHAVAIVLHELHRSYQTSYSSNKTQSITTNPALASEIEDCIQDSQELLLEIGFLLEHTAQSRIAKVRGLFQRACIRSEEIALIRGMLRQIRWAINSKTS